MSEPEPLRFDPPKFDYEPGGRPDWIESVEERAEIGQWTRFAVGFVVGQLFVIALWLCLVVLTSG